MADVTAERRDLSDDCLSTTVDDCRRLSAREDFLYDIKGGSLRSPPPAAGGRKRPSSPSR